MQKEVASYSDLANTLIGIFFARFGTEVDPCSDLANTLIGVFSARFGTEVPDENIRVPPRVIIW